jgi:3'(2'), 5'-bisphosphate nucleotidase
MDHPLQKELAAGLSAVRSAMTICQAVQSAITPEVLDKKDNSPVTIADFASQAVICHQIGQSFEQDPMMAEEDSYALSLPENRNFLTDIHQLIALHYRVASVEDIQNWIDRGSAKDYSSRFWTLDPIDGTKGFIRRDQYAISLALIIDGQLELGILGCPNFGLLSNHQENLFFAIRGQGAFALNSADQSSPRRIFATNNANPALVRLCESFESGHSSHTESAQIAARLGISTPPLRIDSQAKYAAVACGLADAYLRLPAKVGYFEKIWDHAGGVLIATEAGCKVTDLRGSPVDFSCGRELKKNRGVIVTNGVIHDAVLEAAKAVVSSVSS